MLKRKNSQKSNYRWKRKVFTMIFLWFCFGILIFLQTQSFTQIRMLAPLLPPVVQKPKIAFTFIARNRLALDMVWDAFFQVDREAASMLQAQRILPKNALVDPFNEQFVSLSDSCIPLYNFSYTYDYIMSSSTSFVDSFVETKEDPYNPKMDPLIPVQNWRNGSQWVVPIRKHTGVVVKDDAVYTMFQLHCRTKEITTRVLAVPTLYASKEHNCIPDEHYVLTLLAQEGLELELTRRSLTYSSWDLSSAKDPERRGWHPVTYRLSDATPLLIQSIKDIDNIYFETEYRREWCTSKGKPTHCFLFAGKFTRPAALRLLNMVSYVFPQSFST